MGIADWNVQVISLPHGGYGSGCCRWCDFATWPLEVGDRVVVDDPESRDRLAATVRSVDGDRLQITFDRPRRRVPFRANDDRLRRAGKGDPR